METIDEYVARKVEEFKEQFRKERLEKLKQQKADRNDKEIKNGT